MSTTLFSVQTFGAAGDGRRLDTAAIQEALDAAGRAGGGVVYFPPGDYRSGTLYLRSNVTVCLEAGAVLHGSTRKEDYERPEKRSAQDDRYLFYGRDLENVAIVGRGTIDGHGPAFWTRKLINPVVWGPKEWRPRALLYLVNCRNTMIRDVTIRNSPCFTLWLLGCEIVSIRGVTILNPRRGPNTDALDIDCCRNVRICDCHIDAGDDCIALKSDAKRLGVRKPCENITVSNCTLSSTACGVRVGYEGDAPIRNCTFSNLVMTDADIGIDIVSIVLDKRPGLRIEEGPEIEGIVFSDIVMRNVNRPIFMWQGKDGKRSLKGFIRDIAVNNVIARAKNSCYIGGLPERCIEDVELNNVRVTLEGRMKAAEIVPPGVWGGEPIPCGLYARHVRGLRLNNVRVDWGSASGTWQNALRCEYVEGLEMEGLHVRQFKRGSKVPAVQLHRVNENEGLNE